MALRLAHTGLAHTGLAHTGLAHTGLAHTEASTMPKILRSVIAFVGLCVVTSSLAAQQGGTDRSYTVLYPGSQPKSGMMSVTWNWSSPTAGTTAQTNVYEYLGGDQNGKPILGTKIYTGPIQSGASGSNPTNPSPVATGTPGKQYVSRITLYRGGVEVQHSDSFYVFAP